MNLQDRLGLAPEGRHNDKVADQPLPEAAPTEVTLAERTGEYVLFSHGAFYLWLPRIDPIMDLVARRTDIEILRLQSQLPFFRYEHPPRPTADFLARLTKWNHSVCAVRKDHWPLIRDHMAASMLTHGGQVFGLPILIETTIPDCGLLVRSAVLPTIVRQPVYVFGVESASHVTVAQVTEPWLPTEVRFDPKVQDDRAGTEAGR